MGRLARRGGVQTAAEEEEQEAQQVPFLCQKLVESWLLEIWVAVLTPCIPVMPFAAVQCQSDAEMPPQNRKQRVGFTSS